MSIIHCDKSVTIWLSWSLYLFSSSTPFSLSLSCIFSRRLSLSRPPPSASPRATAQEADQYWRPLSPPSASAVRRCSRRHCWSLMAQRWRRRTFNCCRTDRRYDRIRRSARFTNRSTVRCIRSVAWRYRTTSQVCDNKLRRQWERWWIHYIIITRRENNQYIVVRLNRQQSGKLRSFECSWHCYYTYTQTVDSQFLLCDCMRRPFCLSVRPLSNACIVTNERHFCPYFILYERPIILVFRQEE